jgi:hypothetical protein
MKVAFHNEFFKSLRRLARHQTWWYKTYELFRYDIWRFLRNVKKFRKELWAFYPWDYQYNLKLFKRSLVLTLKTIERGNEIEQTRNKKVAKIKRAIEILDNVNEDDYVDIAEKRLGKQIIMDDFMKRLEKIEGKEAYELLDEPEEIRKHNAEIYDLARKIEEEEWRELWDIFKGQNYEDFKPSDREDWTKTDDEYREWFDGSGMKSWWD